MRCIVYLIIHSNYETRWVSSSQLALFPYPCCFVCSKPKTEAMISFIHSELLHRRLLSFCIFLNQLLLNWWGMVVNGRFSPFCLKGCRFESCSSCHVWTLGKSFTSVKL